jgi:DNA-binding NarL/FixJ family response regulator
MPRRVLIADDSPLTRKALLDLLQTHGWQVCGQAENGLEAVRMALELNPDVVILDLAMPTMDGLTAAREISQSLPTMPIVMHTFHDIPQLELEAKKNGVRCIVPKSEIALIISVLNHLTSDTGYPQAVAEKESATAQLRHLPSIENTLPEIEAEESASQIEGPDDIVKAS